MRMSTLIQDYIDLKNTNLFLSTQSLKKYDEEATNEKKRNLQRISDEIGEIIKKLSTIQMWRYLFPHLQNALFPLFIKEKKEDNNFTITFDLIYSLYELLSREDEAYQIIKKYYLNIIKTNNFGIPDELIQKNIITSKTFESKNYEAFVDKLSDWYSKTEMVILHFSLIDYYFNINFETNLSTKITTIKSYNCSVNLFSKRTFLRLAGLLATNCSGEPDNELDLFNKITSLFKMGMAHKMIFNPQMMMVNVNSLIVGAITTLATRSVGKIGNTLANKSESIEIVKITKIIEKANDDYDKLIKSTTCFIDTEISLFLKQEIMELRAKNNKMLISQKEEDFWKNAEKEREEMKKNIEVYMKNISLQDDEKFLIVNEQVENINQNGWVNINLKETKA